MFDGFLIEGNHSLDFCVKYILADTCHTPWKLCIQNYLFGPQRYSNTMMMTQQRKERKLACGFKYFIFTPIWGRFPIWRAYFSDGLVQPLFPNSFTLNDHQINYINSSASGFTQILTWNLEINPWKREKPIGNHHFQVPCYVFRGVHGLIKINTCWPFRNERSFHNK